MHHRLSTVSTEMLRRAEVISVSKYSQTKENGNSNTQTSKQLLPKNVWFWNNGSKRIYLSLLLKDSQRPTKQVHTGSTHCLHCSLRQHNVRVTACLRKQGLAVSHSFYNSNFAILQFHPKFFYLNVCTKCQSRVVDCTKRQD